MKKLVAVFSLFFLLSGMTQRLVAQENGRPAGRDRRAGDRVTNAERMDSALTVYNEAVAEEKIHLHLDRYAYNPGETIWFKAYLLEGLAPATGSRNIFFDWYDAAGKLLKHMAAPIFEASAKGQFDIPAGYQGGYLRVQAYTQWMLNFDAAFLYEKIIPVSGKGSDQTNPDRRRPGSTELEFFPEGGKLMTGLVSKVAFKANDPYGVPATISGIVQGSDGSVVDSLTIVHDGMGSFFVKPAQGVRYTATWTDGSGHTFHKDLPAAAPDGACLQVQPHANESTIIVRRTADGFRALNLLVHMNQRVVYAAQLRLEDKSEVAVSVPTGDLPTGILQFTLFDTGWRPVAERVAFVNNRLHEFTAAIQVVASSLGKRGRNEIEIETPDSVFSNMSVSVTDGDLSEGYDDIVTELLLSDDIRGAIYRPSYYFSGKEGAAKHLDLVMLTHGWRQFKWDDIVQGNMPELRWPRDTGYLALQGKVLPGRVKDIAAGQQVLLILETKDSSSRRRLLVPVMPDGRFMQRGMVFYDTLKVYYDFPGNKKLSGGKWLDIGNGLLSAGPGGFSGLGGLMITDSSGLGALRHFSEEEMDRDKKHQAMLLAAVTVKGHVKRPVDMLDDKYATGVFRREAGYQFDVKDDVLALHSTDIFYYLRQVVPGLDVQYKDGYPMVRWRQGTPSFFVDEAGMKADLVGDIPITDIAYVKIFYPPFLMGGVVNPRAGAIAIYTKKGEDVKPLPTAGLNYKLVEGYAAERQFYSPDYSVDPASQENFLPDIRPTLYWNPFLFTDAGTHTVKVEFYNNDVSKKLRVVVEGMNATGRLVHAEKIIQ